MIPRLEKPEPDYRLRTQTRRVVIQYHLRKGFKLPEGSKYNEWTKPSSEDLITLDMLKEVQRQGPGHVRGYGEVSEIDIENKILCMEGPGEVLISEIETIRDKVKKLEGERIPYIIDLLNKAINQLKNEVYM